MKKLVLFLVLVVIFAAIGGFTLIVRNIQNQQAQYKIQVEKLPSVQREINGSQVNINADEIFSPERVYKLREGQGLEIPFIKTFNGAEVARKEYKVEPWNRHEETTPEERLKYINVQREEFKKAVAWLNSYEGLTWRVAIAIDDTEGISQKHRSLINEILEDMDLEAHVNRGDELELYLYKLSETDFLEKRRVVVEKGEGYPHQIIRQALEWVLGNTTPKKHTSFGTGVFVALSDFTKKSTADSTTISKVVILSDGLENNPPEGPLGGTVSMYKEPNLLDSSNWGELTKRLTKFKEVPKLDGTSIDWYVVGSKPELSPLVRSAQLYWKDLLEKHGAKVTMQN